MAPLPATPSRRTGRPGRPRLPRSASGAQTAPPPKKLKYVPGGPGGGGRYIDPDTMEETPIAAAGSGTSTYTGTRTRVGRITTERMAVTPAAPTPSLPRPRREPARPPLPRSDSTSAAAAAVAQSDGYKPREEREWHEFHPDLDIEQEFMVFSADEVDGVTPPTTLVGTPNSANGLGSQGILGNGASFTSDETFVGPPGTPPHSHDAPSATAINGESPNNTRILITPKKRVGRPPRHQSSMLSGLGSPPTPRIIPLPAYNPKERLSLPKPSYRQVDTFSAFEHDQSVGVNFVDRTMASVGFQESDLFIRSEKAPMIRMTDGSIEEDLDLALATKIDAEAILGGPSIGRVEYDMDEQDDRWLDMLNGQRKDEGVDAIKPAIFEITMTQIEKEWHALEKRIPKPNPKPPQTHRPRSSSAAAVNGEPLGQGEEQDSKCSICDDGDCENTNAIVFCDGCDLAVHQECYGVPFIPEGQWLCRKCQLLGRGTPSCIFCPNVDGAFKQTNTLRWSHLLCAIWIPEVSLGNTTFMEPVMDVEKVQKQRWKLTCYICQQKMGACIQCGNKNCYQAFHVTCARRARLFLKMKSAHSNGIQDASVLKAFCHKHVPADWKRENDVETAFEDAQAFYRHTMRGRRWGDSQQVALARAPEQSIDMGLDHGDDGAAPGSKRKRGQPSKPVWRLPSGAPIVPHAVFHNVENALIRFAIRKRKEFVAEACKYWTLKREARRGAALLKRLQLQMETFSSMEITRRNFVGMGAAGRPKLRRRIEFAERLEDDMEQIRAMCELVKQREQMKLKDVDNLRQLVDALYFPIAPLLWPIFEKAAALDPKGVFAEGFRDMQSKLDERHYTSTSSFVADLIAVFSNVIGAVSGTEVKDFQPDREPVVSHHSLTSEQKEKKKLAKRINKGIQALVDDAGRKEADLAKRPFEKESVNLDALLDRSIRAHTHSTVGTSAIMDGAASIKAPSLDEPMGGMERMKMEADQDGAAYNGLNTNNMMDGAGITEEELQASALSNTESHHEDDGDPNQTTDEAVIRLQVGAGPDTVPIYNSGEKIKDTNETGQADDRGESIPALSNSGSTIRSTIQPESASPEIKGQDQDLLAPLRSGGIPWYAQPFNPDGTTIYEERWTGRDVLRHLSEELSDMDEEDMKALQDEEMTDAPQSATTGEAEEESKAVAAKPKKPKKKTRSWR